jgi:phenylpropionate dioxygenase-like ring-hydroxylating dioxygenase large terminal subunit
MFDQTLIDPVLLNDWHPVAIADQLTIGSITPTQLLDTPITLWRGQDGVIHAWQDRCPHRGAQLSLGKIQNERLHCAYHGWQFGSEGRCKHIPALPALSENNLKGQVTTYQTQVRYGLVWVCLGTPSEPVLPFPEYDDPALRAVICGAYDVASSAPRIVENFLDMAHFAFVHEGILGVEEHAAIADYNVEKFDDTHYGHGIWAKQCRAWQPQASKSAASGFDVNYTYRVVRPLTAILTKQYGDSPVEAISLHLQPLTETTTRAWIILALADFESSDEALRAFQDTIFLQDKPILESQRPHKLPLIAGIEMSVACDRMSLAYRSYLREMGLKYGVISK